MKDDENPVLRHLDIPHWDPRPGVDLDTVIELGRAARHRRRVRRGAAGAIVATVVIVGGGVVVGPLLAADRSRPAAIGPASTSAMPVADPADVTPCAGADTAAAEAVQQDVDVVSSPDYRVPDLDNGLDVTTGALRTRLIAEAAALKKTMTQQRTAVAASPLRIGYVDGGCSHPRYLVAFTVRISRPDQAAPENVTDLYLASALPVDGTWKLDRLDPVDPPAN